MAEAWAWSVLTPAVAKSLVAEAGPSGAVVVADPYLIAPRAFAFLGGTGPAAVGLRLRSISFRRSAVTNLPMFAFQGCTDLVRVDLPSSITSIGSGTFMYCRRLASVVIPPSVTVIGDEAFFECAGNGVDTRTFTGLLGTRDAMC